MCRGCVAAAVRCNGDYACDDKSDEKHCPPCHNGYFECTLEKRCIDHSLVCDGASHCSDGSDEQFCEHVEISHQRSSSAQYTVGVVVGIVAMLFVFIFVWFACRRGAYDTEVQAAFVMSDYPPKLHNKTSKNFTKYDLPRLEEDMSIGSLQLYDRSHVTGASSSQSNETQYPIETLNPPPTPVTDRSLMSRSLDHDINDLSVTGYSTDSVPFLIPLVSRPPHTTPCSSVMGSTDICSTDLSEVYYPIGRPSRVTRYPCPPKRRKPTRHRPPRSPHRRTTYRTEYPPSPSTERSFLNPFPPPPSPEAISDA